MSGRIEERLAELRIQLPPVVCQNSISRLDGGRAEDEQRTEAPDPLEELWRSGALFWSGTPGSNRRPSPWQGEQTESPTVSAPHQPSPTQPNHSGSVAPDAPEVHQRSPTIHNACLPQVFQDGARPLDVAQVAILLGWTKDAVRAACGRGELAHQRDHLNAYRIPCSAVLAVATGLGTRRAD